MRYIIEPFAAPKFWYRKTSPNEEPFKPFADGVILSDDIVTYFYPLRRVKATSRRQLMDFVDIIKISINSLDISASFFEKKRTYLFKFMSVETNTTC